MIRSFKWHLSVWRWSFLKIVKLLWVLIEILFIKLYVLYLRSWVLTCRECNSMPTHATIELSIWIILRVVWIVFHVASEVWVVGDWGGRVTARTERVINICVEWFALVLRSLKLLLWQLRQRNLRFVFGIGVNRSKWWWMLKQASLWLVAICILNHRHSSPMVITSLNH